LQKNSCSWGSSTSRLPPHRWGIPHYRDSLYGDDENGGHGNTTVGFSPPPWKGLEVTVLEAISEKAKNGKRGFRKSPFIAELSPVRREYLLETLCHSIFLELQILIQNPHVVIGFCEFFYFSSA